MAHTEFLDPYTLFWPDGVFPLGGDTLALGKFATVKNRWRVCDLGTGSGALLMLMARRAEGLSLTGVERSPLAAQTARENLARNHLAGEILTADLRNAPLPAGHFDLVISNPPYFSLGSGTSGGSARSEEHCTLTELCAAAGRLTKNGGRFALCHRPERLSEVMCAMQNHHLEPKRLTLVSHSPAHPPSLILVEGRKQARPGLSISCVYTHSEPL